MINTVSASGEPLEPIDNRRKYINQCGVIVRDIVPINLEEWIKPKDVNNPATYVEERLKTLCWDTLLTKVSLPSDLPVPLMDKVKEWSLSKMAEQFRTWKKNLWKAYKKAGETDPDFTGALVKIQQQWPTFVEQRKSEGALARSVQNKLNAAKKEYHHHLGAGGYRAAVPKWEAFEARLLDNGIIPQTAEWPPRSKFWLFAHGAGLDPQTGKIIAQGKWKAKIEYITKQLEDAIDKVRRGEYVPDRENDELTLALGNPEHVGRLRGYGAGVTLKQGFPEDADTYRSRQRRKKQESDRLSALERKVQEQQERLDSISKQNESQLQVEAAPSDQRKSSVGSTHVENSQLQPAAAHYPVDDITEKTDCELHMSMKNMSFKVAVGYALPNPAGASYHLGGIPQGYARVGVDQVVPLYANLELDIPGGDGEKTLGEVEKGIALWNKENIVFPNLTPRSSSRPPPQDPSPPRQDPSPPPQDPPPPPKDPSPHLRIHLPRLKIHLPHLKIHPPKIYPPHMKIRPSMPHPS